MRCDESASPNICVSSRHSSLRCWKKSMSLRHFDNFLLLAQSGPKPVVGGRLFFLVYEKTRAQNCWARGAALQKKPGWGHCYPRVEALEKYFYAASDGVKTPNRLLPHFYFTTSLFFHFSPQLSATQLAFIIIIPNDHHDGLINW